MVCVCVVADGGGSGDVKVSRRRHHLEDGGQGHEHVGNTLTGIGSWLWQVNSGGGSPPPRIPPGERVVDASTIE